MKKARRARLAALALALACFLAALPAQAGTGSEAGWNVGSALASVVYAPVKVAYAGASALCGGIAWGLTGGNPDVFRAVVTPAVRGDYVVTPAHLRRERRLVFVARAPGRVGPAHSEADWDWDEDDGSTADEPDFPYETAPYAADGDAYRDR